MLSQFSLVQLYVTLSQFADATIMYTGDGQVAETNFMGWLARFFISAILPF